MRRTQIIFLMVVAIGVLLAVSGVRAELATPTAPQRTCSATGGLGTVVAGPCLSGIACDSTNSALAQDFPRLVNCPADCNGAVDPATSQPLSGRFLRWDFLFTPAAGTSPSLIGLQVAADIEIEASVGGSLGGNIGSINQAPSAVGVGDSSLQMGAGDWDSKWLRFPGNSTSTNPYLASYFTQQGVKVSPEGIVFKSGKSIGSCGLAGAGTPSCVDPNAALYTDLVFTMPGPCSVTYQVTPDCKAVANSMQVLQGDCTISQTDLNLNIDGKDVLTMGASCPVVTFTQPGSCSYCVYNTFGSKTCSTCTTCCIDNRTGSTTLGKCVLKSILSSPSTQCKPGTF